SGRTAPREGAQRSARSYSRSASVSWPGGIHFVVDQKTLDELRSVEELANYKSSVDSQISQLDEQFAGLPLAPEDRDKFADVAETSHQIEKRIAELEGRKAVLKKIAEGNPASLERAYERAERTLNGPEMN